MAFVERTITLNFQLGQGATFGDSGSKDYTVSGLRVQAKIVKTGDGTMGLAELRVYGLSPTVYKSLCALTYAIQLTRQNSVAVLVGDVGGQQTMVFQGQITLAQIDLNCQPDVVLNVIAQAGLLQAVQPAKAFGLGGAIDAAGILKGVAASCNMDFENASNLSFMLRNPCFAGSYWQQIAKCIEATGWRWTIDQSSDPRRNGTLAIWPANGYRKGFPPPIISAETGMVGYPGYSDKGIAVRTTFNPGLVFGGQAQVKSDIEIFNGVWNVYNLVHTLESQTPDGQWFTEFQGTPYGAQK